MVTSCWLIALLVAGMAFPAAATAAGCCAPAVGDDATSFVNAAGSSDGCCDSEGDAGRSPADTQDGDQPDSCDCFRACCGATSPIATRRTAHSVAPPTPVGYALLAPERMALRDADFELLRPPQL